MGSVLHFEHILRNFPIDAFVYSKKIIYRKKTGHEKNY